MRQCYVLTFLLISAITTERKKQKTSAVDGTLFKNLSMSRLDQMVFSFFGPN